LSHERPAEVEKLIDEIGFNHILTPEWVFGPGQNIPGSNRFPEFDELGIGLEPGGCGIQPPQGG
jgi:hypothetical protein